ncbi:MAG: DUF4412 domain-containing protein [Winogradskyella sp.]|uniref:DUF4412 domain-containing protein n=1 Tax=Winogradskyella sp. TaxID=1883156 RepID=UPI0025F4490A|nr:DUF4412 domain-containing protein [Winogradskyella sp.]NRB59881.1 DUF4412 domain-containing protein [Winogradskyella sp.]
MKIQKALVLFMIALFSANSAQAQLFKRLKDKAKQKLERSVEEAVEKEIDSFSLEKKKTKKEKRREKKSNSEQITSKGTSGSAVLKHTHKYGNYPIDEFGKAKLERTNSGVKIFGSWVTHAADIHDGYVLDIPNGNALLFKDDQPILEQITFKIPEEATLKLSYDPFWEPELEDENGFSSAVTRDYQTYDIESGEVIIDVVSKGNVQFSFTGAMQLETRIKNQNNTEQEYTSSFMSSSISGAIDVGPVQFFDNRMRKETNEETQVINLPSLDNNAAIPGIYNFTFKTDVKLTNLDENETYQISYLLNPEAKYIGMMADMSEFSEEEMNGESLIVMDGEDVHIFVEAEGMKMRMSQGMMGGQQMQNPAEEMANYDYTNLKKTGNTKSILGAECHEYVMSDNNVSIELWVAPEVTLPNWFIQNTEVLNGHIMEYTITSNEGNMRSETIAINDHINKTINPKEYKKMF